MSSWGQLLRCHHHPGAEMPANGTHMTPLAADWPHISAWSHNSFKQRERCSSSTGQGCRQQAGRLVREQLTHHQHLLPLPGEAKPLCGHHLPPAASEPLGSAWRRRCLSAGQELCQAEGASPWPQSPFPCLRDEFDAGTFTSCCSRWSEPGDHYSIQRFSGQNALACMWILEGVKNPPRT